MIEAITFGVISNFVYAAMANRAPESIMRLAPALFFGGPTPLLEADKAFADAKSELLERHQQITEVHLFLSPEKTIKGGVLNSLFENIFLNKPTNNKAIDDAFYSCFADPKQARRQNYQHLIDDITDTIRRHLLSKDSTSAYVIFACIEEIKTTLKSIESISKKNLSRLESLTKVDSTDKNIDEFSKSYLEDLKDYVQHVFIHGLEMISKRDTISHFINDAYVPVLVNQLLATNYDTATVSTLNAFDAIRDARKAIIRGPAGCGKTTLLQWIIWNAEPFEKGSKASEAIPYFPIYIPLRKLEKAGTHEFSIKQILHDTMPNDVLKKNLPVDWLGSIFERGIEVILLVDGVDEVREANRSKIWRFIRSISEKYPTLRILITSRHVSSVHLSDGAYRPDIFLSRDSHLEAKRVWDRPDDVFEFIVSELSNGEIVALIDKWYKGVEPEFTVKPEQKDLQYYPDQLKEALFRDENATTLELARTPLLCSLICLIFFLQKGRLPNNRKQLYSFSTELLIETRDEHRGVNLGLEYTPFDLARRLKMLRHIALIMQEGSETVDADQSIEVPKASVVGWLEKWLGEQSALTREANDYLDFLIERCSIIREPSSGRIDFVHRSFMEFLAAEEIVQARHVYQIQEKIVFDEWQNTLQFCMSTVAGGSYYGCSLIEGMLQFVNGNKNLPDKRKVLLKILYLLNFMDEVPTIADEAIEATCRDLFPPESVAEVNELVGVPIRILKNIIDYKKIELQYTSNQVSICTDILCRHEDDDSKKLLLTGYHLIDDRDIIEKINHSQKLTVIEHDALRSRLKNRSYSGPVYLTTEELSDKGLRSAMLHAVWIRFPASSESFVGWDYLYRCRDVRLQFVSQHDLQILTDSVKVRRFDNCKYLVIENGHGFDFDLIPGLFPSVETISIERSSGISLKGMGKFRSLIELWFTYCTDEIVIQKENVPESLKNIVFDRSVNPLEYDDLKGCSINFETQDKDEILVSYNAKPNW